MQCNCATSSVAGKLRKRGKRAGRVVIYINSRPPLLPPSSSNPSQIRMGNEQSRDQSPIMSSEANASKRPLDESNTPPAKRARGRPKKDPNAATSAPKDPNTPARGRGRPKGSTSVKSPKDPKVATAGRGRPKGSTAATKSPKAGGERRGRPKKTDNEPVKGPSRRKKDDAVTKPAAAATSNASSTPGRGRGRPRKDANAAAPAKSSTQIGKGRGRPKKDSSTLQGKTTQPASGGARGRPKKNKDASTEEETPAVEDTTATPATPAHLVITSDVEGEGENDQENQEEQKDQEIPDQSSEAPVGQESSEEEL